MSQKRQKFVVLRPTDLAIWADATMKIRELKPEYARDVVVRMPRMPAFGMVTVL